jgi:hypothetical protein
MVSSEACSPVPLTIFLEPSMSSSMCSSKEELDLTSTATLVAQPEGKSMVATFLETEISGPEDILGGCFVGCGW